ncbi:MAG: hypothetical protein ABIY55_35390 [Kofleriaceae bacterium]
MKHARNIARLSTFVLGLARRDVSPCVSERAHPPRNCRKCSIGRNLLGFIVDVEVSRLGVEFSSFTRESTRLCADERALARLCVNDPRADRCSNHVAHLSPSLRDGGGGEVHNPNAGYNTPAAIPGHDGIEGYVLVRAIVANPAG